MNKPNPNCPKCNGKGEYYFFPPGGSGSPNLVKCDCGESKPSESRLLDINEWLDAIGCDRAYKKDMKDTYVKAIVELEAQRDLTASIIHQEYAEHLVHLVDDVINLEEKLKSKDAECQQKIDLMYNPDYLDFQKGVEAERIICQQRVEGVKIAYKEAFHYHRGEFCISPKRMIELEKALGKEEGI